MLDSRRTDLSNYRLEKAYEMLQDAELLLKEERFASCTNRAYYAIFNAMRAVLAIEGVEFRKHSGNIAHFLKAYVKTGIFKPDVSDMILSASKARNNSDYDDFYVADEQEALEQIANAREFLSRVSAYLETTGLNDLADDATEADSASEEQ